MRVPGQPWVGSYVLQSIYSSGLTAKTATIETVPSLPIETHRGNNEPKSPGFHDLTIVPISTATLVDDNRLFMMILPKQLIHFKVKRKTRVVDFFGAIDDMSDTVLLQSFRAS